MNEFDKLALLIFFLGLTLLIAIGGLGLFVLKGQELLMKEIFALQNQDSEQDSEQDLG